MKWLDKDKRFRMIITRESRPVALYFDFAYQGKRVLDGIFIGKFLSAFK